MSAPRLMAVLAHPDDESLGFGGTLAKYAAEGVDVSVLTATRGDAGRYRGHPPERRAPRRRAHWRRSARGSCVRPPRCSACASWRCSTTTTSSSIAPRRGEVIDGIARHIRRIRPDVVLTFGPDGAYGHPDHIAISQFTTAAIVAAAARALTRRDPEVDPPHAVSKLYYLAWPASAWAAYRGRVPPADFHRRRHRATGHALAGMGDHYGDRYTRLSGPRSGRRSRATPRR